MLYRSLILYTLILISCKNNRNTTIDKTSADTSVQNTDNVINDTRPLSEDKISRIIDTLQNLQIVKEASRIIDSASLGSRHISYLPDSVAHPNGELYIAVGDNRPERFETFINFYINVQTSKIRVYDVVRDDTVDVDVYEQRQKTAWKQ